MLAAVFGFEHILGPRKLAPGFQIYPAVVVDYLLGDQLQVFAIH
jgi:hypothetical protein